MDKEKSLDEQLVLRLKAIRKQHRVSQRAVAKCMETGVDAIPHIGVDTVRHIEKGRRPLPDFMHGRVAWVRKYLKCVGATPKEEQEILVLTSRTFIGQFSDWMLYLENRLPGS